MRLLTLIAEDTDSSVVDIDHVLGLVGDVEAEPFTNHTVPAGPKPEKGGGGGGTGEWGTSQTGGMNRGMGADVI